VGTVKRNTYPIEKMQPYPQISMQLLMRRRIQEFRSQNYK
jgi:hypothetical protein